MEKESVEKKEAGGAVTRKVVGIAVTMLAVGVLVGVVIALNLPSILPPQEKGGEEASSTRVEGVSVDDDPFLGQSNAPVTVIEFSDFQCPFCRRFVEETLQEIKRNYVDTGKIRWVYRDYPLSQIHPYAEKAAEAADCAGEQGRFWEYHDLLFKNQAVWSAGGATVEFRKYASSLGLEEGRFNSCLDSGKYADEVSKDLADGLKAGVEGTPTFFVNGVKVVGAQPYDVFKTAIDAQLKR